MSLNQHPKLKSALDSFAKEYLENPIKYLYEVDAQVLLSKHLEATFNEKHELHGQMESNKGRTFDLGKVHREYPRYKSTKPIDNVVLGKPKQYTEEELKKSHRIREFL